MKKLFYICFAMLLLSCANTSEEKSFATSDMAESEAAEPAVLTIEEPFPYATITEQKLQEYYDLATLQNKHPEFAETIAPQLRKLAKDAIVLVKGQDSVAVKNLSALGEIVAINDTLQQQRFTYAIASKTMFKSDTLTANIISKPTVLDGTETVSTRVIFSKN